MALGGLVATAAHNLALVLARTGRLEEGHRLAVKGVEAFLAQSNRRLEGVARVYLAEVLRLEGDLAGAEREAREAAAKLEAAPPLRPLALATLADVLLAAGKTEPALEVAREATACVQAAGGVEEGDALVRLVLARALAASGDHEAARATLTAARAELLARAERIRDPALRRTFLDRIPEHAATLALTGEVA
jgi:hypothetical protein